MSRGDTLVRTVPTERRLAAIMFTDIVGYTALMARDEDTGAPRGPTP